MNQPFHKQVVCLTGAAGGIASAIARQLAQAGAHLALLDIDRERLSQLATEIRAQHHPGLISEVVCDLSREQGVKEGMAQVLAPFDGHIDILINNVGVLVSKRFLDLSSEAWQHSLTINFLSHVWAAQAVLPTMVRQHRGRILFMGSDQASQPDKNLSAYAAAKAALHNLTKTLARELAPEGIFVAALAPGMTRTRLVVETLMEAYAEELGTDPAQAIPREIERRGIPLGRLGEPEEVASAALFLLSNAFATGSILDLSGGNRRGIA